MLTILKVFVELQTMLVMVFVMTVTIMPVVIGIMEIVAAYLEKRSSSSIVIAVFVLTALSKVEMIVWTLFRVLVATLRGKEIQFAMTRTTMEHANGMAVIAVMYPIISSIAQIVVALIVPLLLPQMTVLNQYKDLVQMLHGRGMEYAMTIITMRAVIGMVVIAAVRAINQTSLLIVQTANVLTVHLMKSVRKHVQNLIWSVTTTVMMRTITVVVIG